MRVRVITCGRCSKERWAPQVPEAMHGWVCLPDKCWRCPDCQEKVTTAIRALPAEAAPEGGGE